MCFNIPNFVACFDVFYFLCCGVRSCITSRILSYGNSGIFLMMGFCGLWEGAHPDLQKPL